MPIVPHIDRVDTLNADSVMGCIRSLTRVARVTGLGSSDYTVLYSGLSTAGIPTEGTSLAADGYPQLVLAERQIKVVNEDPSTVDVTLNYKHVLDGPYQNLFPPSIFPQLVEATIYGKTRASVVQKPTNFYYGTFSAFGVGIPVKIQIIVQHKFPFNDPDFPGQTQMQGGEINGQFPGRNFQFEGFIDTASPWLIEQSILGFTNLLTWKTFPPFYWLCTEAQWDLMGYPLGSTTPRYRFHFEFQYNSDSWNPTAVFIDSRTNKPPPNLVSGVGYMDIPVQPSIDFNAFFGATFEGN